MSDKGWAWVASAATVWAVVWGLEQHQAAVDFAGLAAWPALVWQLAAVLGLAATYQAGLRLLEVDAPLYRVLPLMLVSLQHHEVETRKGPTSWLAEDARTRGYSLERATAGVLLARMASWWAFELIFAAALGALLLHPVPRAILGAGLIVLLVLAPALGSLIAFLVPERATGWLNRIESRFGTPPGWASRRLANLTDASLAGASRPLLLVGVVLLALLVHLLHLATLAALLAACQWRGHLAVLCSVLAVSVLSRVVPVVPQRAGLVEALMVVTGIGLGMPPPTALIGILGYRLLSYWLPYALGFSLVGRGPARLRHDLHLRAGDLSVKLVATLTAAMGVINAASGVRPGVHERLVLMARWLPLDLDHGSRTAAVVLGFVLLDLSWHLWHRKRVAWILTELALALSAVTHLLKGLAYEEAGLAVALAVWAATLRSQFHARSDAPSVRHGLAVLAGAVIFTLSYGVFGLWVIEHRHREAFDVPSALSETVSILSQFDTSNLPHRSFVDSLVGVEVASLAYGLFLLLRPVLMRQPGSRADWQRAYDIVQRHARTSLAPFALLTDKLYHFTPGGSVVAYVVKGRIALALADPIGPPADLPAAIASFASLCEANDWTPAWHQTGVDTVQLYAEAGFDTVCVGMEAVVDVQAFTLAGGAAKNLRSIINKVKRAGYRTEVHQPPLSDDVLAAMRDISDEWLTLMHGTEKQFCLGWFDVAYLQRGPVCSVYDSDNHMVAFANILSEYQKPEATGDLMRRRKVVENGTMELVFVALFEWTKAQGLSSFSLGLCPLAGVGEKPDDPVMERAVHHVYEHVNQFYNFKGLHAFKEKFHPSWTPRYLVFPPRSLPAVGVAIIRATSGDTFLWDSLRDLFTPKGSSRPVAAPAPATPAPDPG